MRCPVCRGFLHFNFFENTEGLPVYNCTRCPGIDERLFVIGSDATPREVTVTSKSHKHGKDWFIALKAVA